MDVQRSMTRDDFHEIVKRAKEYIEAGDVFQVVLSQQFRIPLQVDPFTIYRHLRLINPSPYLFFLRCEGPVLIGSSPEILVRLGARPDRPAADRRHAAGADARPKTTARSRRSCCADPKERAEHLMLVDLGRNDVGRVAEIGSVHVNEYGVVERYSHVMHIVSNVQGRLREGLRLARSAARDVPGGHAVRCAEGARHGDHRRARDAAARALRRLRRLRRLLRQHGHGHRDPHACS